MALWQIVCGSETVIVSEAECLTKTEELFARFGVQPTVTRVEETDVPVVLKSTPAPTPAVTPVVDIPPAPLPAVVANAMNTARIVEDKNVLRKNGFALQPGFFADGTELYDIGTENARQHRKDFDEMPVATDSLDKLIKTVRAEKREDVTTNIADLRMLPNGDLTRGKGRLGIEERAITSLGTRLGIPNASYLSNVWPDLRAINWNAWAKKIQSTENPKEPTQVVLRTRKNDTGRQVFGVVSPKYGAMDIDIIAQAIQKSLDSYKGAKATISYDGHKSRIEVLFHTTVKPEHQAVGEVFRAGVIVGTDDTGGGSAWVQGSAWFVLCKNYTYTNAGVPVANIRHIGNVEALTLKFRNAFDAGLGKFDHFLKAWGYAQEENVISTCKDDEIVGKAVSVALPGLFRGVIERELVPVKGRTEENIAKLLKHWEGDESSARNVTETSRASIVNAFTRFAHSDVADPFESSEIERAASKLLYSKKPLPFLPAKGQ